MLLGGSKYAWDHRTQFFFDHHDEIIEENREFMSNSTVVRVINNTTMRAIVVRINDNNYLFFDKTSFFSNF